MRKAFLPFKTGKRRFATPKGEERIYNWKLSKFSAIERRMPGACSQEESGLSIIKLRGTVKLSWSIFYFKIHTCSYFLD